MASTFDLTPHLFHSDKFKSVVEDAVNFFNKTPLHTLPPPERFAGPGVYGLYYLGDFHLYSKLAEKNRQDCVHPIYIGEAMLPGSRKGVTTEKESWTLLGRLRDHQKSIAAANNLNLQDFRCRFMVLMGIETDLILPVESALIRKYSPVWNQGVDGFGNHTPGEKRFDQKIAGWDVLHPGRSWLAKQRERKAAEPPLEEIERKIKSFLG